MCVTTMMMIVFLKGSVFNLYGILLDVATLRMCA